MAMRKPKRVNPFPGQATRKVFNWGDSSAEEPIEEIRPVVTKLKNADIVTSEVADDQRRHKIVLDIDFPVVVVPSTTKGHHHLFIDKEMSWEQYVEILEALVNAGVIENGYLGASKERGFTGVRLPWVRKPQVQPEDRAEPEDF